MFIGHFGVGFGLKRMAPRTSLATLMAAVAWADILWTAFLLLGWEHVRISIGDTKWTALDLYDYPWSHSLLMMVVWGTVLALAYRAWRTDAAGAWAVGIGVVSHWALDWITHRADMPLYPGGPKFGLGLWDSIAGTIVAELWASPDPDNQVETEAQRASDRWFIAGSGGRLSVGSVSVGRRRRSRRRQSREARGKHRNEKVNKLSCSGAIGIFVRIVLRYV